MLKRSPRKYRRKPKQHLSDWMVVQVKPRCERLAAIHIRRHGGKPLALFITEQDQFKEEPLFPGFIFVQGPEWYYLLSTPGVLRPIMLGDQPGFVRLKEMKPLLKLGNEEGLIMPAKETFKPGQAVRMRRTAWAGHLGKFKKLVGKDRVRVLLSMLGGEHEFEFKRSDITGVGVADGQGAG